MKYLLLLFFVFGGFCGILGQDDKFLNQKQVIEKALKGLDAFCHCWCTHHSRQAIVYSTIINVLLSSITDDC